MIFAILYALFVTELYRALKWLQLISLGKHWGNIIRVHEAIDYSVFYKQLGKDADQLVEKDMRALKERPLY